MTSYEKWLSFEFIDLVLREEAAIENRFESHFEPLTKYKSIEEKSDENE